MVTGDLHQKYQVNNSLNTKMYHINVINGLVSVELSDSYMGHDGKHVD